MHFYISSSCNVSITVWSISVTRSWIGNMFFSSIVTQARKSYGTWWVCSLDRLLSVSRVCSFSHQNLWNFNQNIALYFSTNKVDKILNLFMSTPNTKTKKSLNDRNSMALSVWTEDCNQNQISLSRAAIQ